jgi:regulator of protease activity HflC (stomatin/prohibitin superfamily)
MSIQTKESKEKADVPTKEGLTVHVELSVIYNIKSDSAASIYQNIGEKYEDVVVIPMVRSVLRDVTSRYEAKDLYTANRSQIEAALVKDLTEIFARNGILVQSVLLRDVQLPPSLKERIEAKLAADQDAQRMAFVLQKEKQEAERKVVEAKGIADAQQIIKKDLSHEYLIYLWIEALKEGAKHNNAVIYVPTGGDGMPLFKGVPSLRVEGK